MDDAVVQAPEVFERVDAGLGAWALQDPRSFSPACSRAVLDLGACREVGVEATLWCLVWLASAAQRGVGCRLLPPRDTVARAGLISLGLFEALRVRGVDVPDGGEPDGVPAEVIVPITAFATEQEASHLANRTAENLASARVSSMSLTGPISDIIGELAMNAVQHAQSRVGAFACVRFEEPQQGPRFVCAVADGGVGVLATLRRNASLAPRLHHDWDALDLAIRDRVSGLGDPHRGIGLHVISEDLRGPDRSFVLHSGIGRLSVDRDVQISAMRAPLFPGTLACVSLPG
jgi:anti-sigma regulatory factor (Ser/Thr protein kinase)